MGAARGWPQEEWKGCTDSPVKVLSNWVAYCREVVHEGKVSDVTNFTIVLF